MGPRRVRAALAVVAVVGGLAGCGGQHQGRITVTPASSLRDQPVHIVVSGVGSRRRVTVALRSVDAHGVRWSSRAVFRSSPSGTVDLAHSPSGGGSYEGVDPMGLVNALRPSCGRSAEYFWHGQQPQRFAVRVTEGGQTVAAGSFLRRGAAPGVSVTDESIAATGFYGQFWRPRAGGPRQSAVLEFGGSEGGLDGQLLGSQLASAGYPTLDIAYFGEPGLPSHLRDIPLGYFARALRWLARQPGVAARRIYVSGASRGSEAALLLGVHYPELVHGVIASSPSDLSFGAYLGPYTTRPTPAWTYREKPVPYSRAFSSFSQIHDPAATIAVQRIHGPVLLDCGTADQVWTSCAYASAIQQRLLAARDPDPHVLYRYTGAGHFVNELIPYEPSFSNPGGGVGNTPLANADADARLWPHVLSFLAHPAGHTGTFTASATPPPLTAAP